MELFNTASDKLEVPSWGNEVRIYVCGITPYDSAHLGHIFTFATYDILQRYLENSGHIVDMVRNITDVDEPIYLRAAQLDIPYTELASREILLFQKTMRQLNFRSVNTEPLASQYIPEMAEAVDSMLSSKHAYQLPGGDIYFDTASIKNFGQYVGRLSNSLQLHFMRDRGGDIDRVDKRQPRDFLLWKSITDRSDPAAWESIVGYGRPGWHIECSVMSSKLLHESIDIHGGGMDLIFPHHEAEAAQNVALYGSTSVRHWMHVAPLLYKGEKMSKSLGNLVFASELLEKYDSNSIRLALLRYHYRTGGEWQQHYLDDAVSLLALLSSPIPKNIEDLDNELYKDRIFKAFMHDLDTPEIIRTLWEWASRGGRMKNASLHSTLEMLGLKINESGTATL